MYNHILANVIVFCVHMLQMYNSNIVVVPMFKLVHRCIHTLGILQCKTCMYIQIILIHASKIRIILIFN